MSPEAVKLRGVHRLRGPHTTTGPVWIPMRTATRISRCPSSVASTVHHRELALELAEHVAPRPHRPLGVVLVGAG